MGLMGEERRWENYIKSEYPEEKGGGTTAAQIHHGER